MILYLTVFIIAIILANKDNRGFYRKMFTITRDEKGNVMADER